ncbi:MAG: hypothetical protein MOB07_20430 [Acidobacteria bacterium]|nr:hypothetical protein [Acidobacteriota bacterium]
MARILFTFLFTTIMTITALGQGQNQPEIAAACSLSISQAPVIRGIRLGMKPDEWLKLFPGSSRDEKIKAILDLPPRYPSYGASTIQFDPPSLPNSSGFKYLPREEFLGVDRVILQFIDNQIFGFQIDYARTSGGEYPWDDISQLITIFSDTFNLPKISAWEKNDNRIAILRCSGFDLQLDTLHITPKVYLSSKPNFTQIIQQRREADKQKARAAFKP